MGNYSSGLVVILAVLPGCLRNPSYHCDSDQSCTVNGTPGRCESTGFCSFGDATRPSGNRYGDSAGGYAGQCAGGQPGGDGGDSIDGSEEACVGTGFEKVCLGASPPATLDLNGPINTDTDTRCLAAYTMV